MKKFPVWLDCDVGVDDAIAIMTAHALSEIDLLAISTVSGNAPLSATFPNAHRMNGLMKTHYPVYKGADRPLLVEPQYAAAFHGENGLGDVELPLPEDAVMNDTPAWDALYACAKQHPGELRLIAIGPLTNIAIALTKYPELKTLLHTILIMGGAASGGNVTPAAEFNIYADPDAAQIVFKSGVPIVMCGLDVTLQAVLTPEDWDELAATGTPAGACLEVALPEASFVIEAGAGGMGAALLSFGRTVVSRQMPIGFAGVAMHDTCPVMYLAHPELFRAEEAGVYVETRGSITRGKTVTDLYSDKQFETKNARVVLGVDRDRFIAIVKDCIKTI